MKNKENIIKELQAAIENAKNADCYAYEAFVELRLYGDNELIKKMQDVRADLIRAKRITSEILQQIEK